MNLQEYEELYNKLILSKLKWQQKDFTENPQFTMLNAARDNDIQFLEELTRRYESREVKAFTASEVQFALQLVRRANRL